VRRTARPRARPDGLHAGLITRVESAYGQLAVPEYRSWGDRGITVRWFSAPGKLLRLDGRGPYCWLIAGCQTPADLEPVRSAIPGPWARVQWPGQEPHDAANAVTPRDRSDASAHCASGN
jgi:hypothetical protein